MLPFTLYAEGLDTFLTPFDVHLPESSKKFPRFQGQNVSKKRLDQFKSIWTFQETVLSLSLSSCSYENIIESWQFIPYFFVSQLQGLPTFRLSNCEGLPDSSWKSHKFTSNQREKLGTLGRVPDIYTNIYHQYNPIYGLYTGCIGQDGVIFGEQLLGYPAKGTQHFPLKK